MTKKTFTFEGLKSQFSILEHKDFFAFSQNINSFIYDKIYRIIDISGSLAVSENVFNASGYGFATVVKMSKKHLEQLDKNIHQMVNNLSEKKYANYLLSVNDAPDTLEVTFEIDGLDLAVVTHVIKDDAYVIILDSMPNYCNYFFLFSGIHDFKGQNMSFMLDCDPFLEDKHNNFYFYSGDENTDGSFPYWLEEEAPKIYKQFVKVGILTPDELEI